MKRVKDLLRGKNPTLYSVNVDDSVLETLQLMAEKNVGALMVMENGKPIGIVSERDYARKVILKGKSSEKTKVSEIMTSPFLSVGLEHKIDECMSLMTDKGFRHLPVLDDEQLVTVISIKDIVKFIIAEQQSTIEELERYITG